MALVIHIRIVGPLVVGLLIIRLAGRVGATLGIDLRHRAAGRQQEHQEKRRSHHGTSFRDYYGEYVFIGIPVCRSDGSRKTHSNGMNSR
jgi:hypothetical protein